MKLTAIPFSAGSLGMNVECDLAPAAILEGLNHAVAEVDNSNFDKTNKIIENLESDISIGGDHSTTYGLFKNFSKKNENAGLIIFDAHCDCVDNFSPPTHEDFNKVLIEEGYLKSENLMFIGLRRVDSIEQDYLDEKGIKYILMEDIKDNATLINEIKKFTSKLDNIYLSLDIDVLDPSEAPGTGYLEDNGMSLSDFKYILGEIIDEKIKQVDIVEVNPVKDVDGLTVRAAREVLDLLMEKCSF